MSRHKARQQALELLYSREFHGENDIQYSEQEILENELVESTDAYKNGHVVYLAHPNVWYTAEGGIQALSEMLSDLENALL